MTDRHTPDRHTPDRNSPDRNSQTSEPGRRPEQILVVDDDWGIGDCVEILLGRAGYE